MESAHHKIRKTARRNVQLRQMGTTATVSIIHDGILYLGHIGDSRAYLVRDGEILQLTLDHSWMNENVRLGKISLEKASRHPRKDELIRYVGQPTVVDIAIDLGVRLDGAADPATSELTLSGLELQPGDVILLCSDGLIKERKDAPGHFVEDREIVRVLQKNEPQDAANTLMSLALGRQVDDNVSVVILEMPGKKKPLISLPVGMNPTILTAGIGTGVVLALFVVIYFAIIKPSGNPPIPPTTMDKQTITNTIAISNDEPSYTNWAKLEDGHDVKLQKPNSGLEDIEPGDKIPIGKDVKLFTGDGTATIRLDNGTEYVLMDKTTVYLDSVNAIRITRGGLLVIADQSGHVEVEYKQEGNNCGFAVENGIVGFLKPETKTDCWVDCLLGSCTVYKGTAPLSLNGGQSGGYTGMGQAIKEAAYDKWMQYGLGRVPTPTFTPTMTATNTPTPTLMPTATKKPVIVEPTPKDQNNKNKKSSQNRIKNYEYLSHKQ